MSRKAGLCRSSLHFSTPGCKSFPGLGDPGKKQEVSSRELSIQEQRDCHFCVSRGTKRYNAPITIG